MQKEITVYAYDWFDKIDPIEGSTSINAWCLDRNSKPYLVRFEGFGPSIYIELPFFVNRARYIWTKEDADEFYQALVKRLDDHMPISYEVGYYKTLYRGNADHPMLKVKFKNKIDITYCENILKRPFTVSSIGDIFCKVWHSKISTVLQFLTKSKCKYSQWFTINGIKVMESEKISTLSNEYICDYDQIKPIDLNLTKSWIAMPHVMVIDIETYSDNPKAMPIRTMDSHVAYMISCIYQKIGDPSTRKRYLILLGDSADITIEEESKLIPVEIIKVKNEADLCLALCELIGKYDPEIISGYNILGFDYPYLNARLERLVKSWDEKASRLIGIKPEIVIPKKWESKGYGYTENYFINFPGRISIDMLPIIRRSHKLPKYDLDTVGNAFLKRGKHDIKPIQMFQYYEYYTLHKNYLEKSIFKWSESELQYSDKLLPLIKQNKDTFGSLYPVFHDNVNEDVLIEILTGYTKAKENLAEVGKYCIQDSELVIDLIDKTGIWISLVELSNIVGVTIVDTYSRGQQIRGLSQAYDLLEKLNVVIDYKPPDEKSKFSGGFVAEPIPNTYDFVITLDFTSLYPTIIMAYNICMNTYLYPGQEVGLIKDTDYDEIKCPVYDDKDVIVGENIHRFLKKDGPNGREGYIPRLVRYLVENRKLVKVEMGKLIKSGKNEEDLECKVLNERQLGLKVSGNSVYGMMGVKTGALLPFLQGAESVTAIGREKIQYCNKYLEDKYNAKVVYNDTDSTMFILPFVKTYSEAIEWGHKLEKELTSTMRKPMGLEMEKVGRMLCIKKKKYAYWCADIMEFYNDKLTGDRVPNAKYGKLKDYKEDSTNIIVRGIVLARRDNCKLLRVIYREMMQNVLDRVDMKIVLSKLMKECIKLYRGEVDPSMMMIIRSIGSHYKSDNYFLKVFGEELKKLGKPVTPGDRIEYLICKGDGLLGARLRTPDIYFERLNTANPDVIDYRYYLENLFIKSLEQLWYVGYRSKIDEFAAEYDQLDKLEIITEIKNISKKDKGVNIVKLWDHYRGNINMIIEWLDNKNHDLYVGNESIHKYLYNKYIKARQNKVSGRSVFNPRITANPIKLLLKAIDMNQLNDYAKVVLTEEDYKELF